MLSNKRAGDDFVDVLAPEGDLIVFPPPASLKVTQSYSFSEFHQISPYTMQS